MANKSDPCLSKGWVVFLLALLLGVLHHDWWYWGDKTLLFGFLPIGLAYHALFSTLATALWAFAVFFAWPKGLEEPDDDSDGFLESESISETP